MHPFDDDFLQENLYASEPPVNSRLNERAAKYSDQDALLDNWDAERLIPTSCNLRSVVLFENGKPTGAASLAQEIISRS